MTSIRVENLTKTFETDDQSIVAVDNATFEIRDGEFMVLVGPSGCGKTTTLRMIAGLEDPTEGKILFDDRVVNEVKPRNRNISMVFQDFALYPHMTVKKNIGFGLERSNDTLDVQDIDNKVFEVASMLEIEDLIEQYPSELSGGQKQRVALGRAIARQPNVFLFDEPLANLDANLRKTMRIEIDDLQSTLDVTSLYVTHNQEEAMTMADRIAVMNEGVIQQIGTPEMVFNNPVNLFVAKFIGSPDMNFIPGELIERNGLLGLNCDLGEFEISSDTSKQLFKNSGGVTIGIRPQDLHLIDSDDPSIRFPAEITLIEPLGTEAIIQTVAGEHRLQAVIDDYEELSIGDIVNLCATYNDICIFDDNSTLIKGRREPKLQTNKRV
jgi:multiple sugar transport system ATP-binding protein